MIQELDKEQLQNKGESQIKVQNLSREKALIEKRMDKLLDLYIDSGTIAPEEYQAKKEKLLNEKLSVQEKMKDFEHEGENRLERMRAFITEANQAKILLNEIDPTKYRAFLQTIGSNVLLTDKKCQFQAKTGWKILLKSPPFPNWRKG